MKIYQFISLSCCTMVLILSACQSNTKSVDPGAYDVLPTEFATLIASGQGQLVDVRTPEEYNEGHIKGAVNINFYDDKFKSQLDTQLDPKKPVYVYCRSGGRSGKTAKLLIEEMKYSKPVYNLLGGFTAWKKEGRE